MKKEFIKVYNEAVKVKMEGSTNVEGEQYSFMGYAEDGKGKYKSNFPKGTPKSAKGERILRYIQDVWSKKPIRLKITENGDVRYIEASFDPTYDEGENIRTDASKLMGGNRHGTSSEQRVTLDLSDDYYQIATESQYNYSKDETGKDNPTHRDVKKWHYFVNDIYFAEYDSEEYVPYRVSINVKERSDGNYVYSFSAEKQRESDTPRTLHAVVNEGKNSNANVELSDSRVTQKSPIVNNYSMQETDDYSIPTQTDAENLLDRYENGEQVDFESETIIDALLDKKSQGTAGNRRLTSNDLEDYMSVGKTLHTRNKKTRMLEAGKKPILTSSFEISEFILNVIHGKAMGEVRAYGIIGERLAKAIQGKRKGLELEGKYLELNADDLREAYKRHLNPKEKGDIPLTDGDFINIPEYLDSFDEVLSVNEYNGKVEIHLAKETNDGYVRILTVSSNERDSLQVTKIIGVSKEKFEAKYGNKKERATGSLRGFTENSENSNPSTTAQLTAGALSNNSIPEKGQTVNINFIQETDDYSIPTQTDAESLLDRYENGEISRNEYLNLLKKQKTLNPVEIANLTKEDASTTPPLERRKGENKGDKES